VRRVQSHPREMSARRRRAGDQASQADHRMGATTSRAVTAIAPTPCSPPPASTSACSSMFGWLLRALLLALCRSLQIRASPNNAVNILHGD